MSQKVYETERLQYIAALLTDMQLHGVDIERLGNIALELLVSRRKIEDVLEGNYPEDQKNYAKKMLLRIKDLEKSIVSLYAIGRLRGEKWTEHPLFDYIMRGYDYERRRR